MREQQLSLALPSYALPTTNSFLWCHPIPMPVWESLRECVQLSKVLMGLNAICDSFWNNAARVRHGHYSRLKLVGSQCRKQRFLWVPALSGCKPIEGNPLCNRNLMVYVPWPYVLAWWQSSMMNVIWLFTSCIRPDIFSELDNEVFPYHYWLSLNPK